MAIHKHTTFRRPTRRDLLRALQAAERLLRASPDSLPNLHARKLLLADRIARLLRARGAPLAARAPAVALTARLPVQDMDGLIAAAIALTDKRRTARKLGGRPT
jgi:hypothetical protein